jgi:hypothetical protein
MIDLNKPGHIPKTNRNPAPELTVGSNSERITKIRKVKMIISRKNPRLAKSFLIRLGIPLFKSLLRLKSK